jgi:hypothetical protein
MSFCIECGCNISHSVFDYSVSNIGHPLCIDHQRWLNTIFYNSSTTPHAIELYFALKRRGVPAELEKWDGYKTIDITVTDAKVNIEVDGKHHNYNHQQALSDLKRTYFSFQKGYLTLRIPNSLVEWSIEETADYITGFLNESKNRKNTL